MKHENCYINMCTATAFSDCQPTMIVLNARKGGDVEDEASDLGLVLAETIVRCMSPR